jgi:tetratricopeptide (TPR) repeat protein
MKREVFSSLLRGCAECENVWGLALMCAREGGFGEEVEAASRRLVSYNPQNQLIPQLSPMRSVAIEAVCNLIKVKVNSLATNPSDVDSWKIILFGYLLLGDYPNAYSVIAHILRISRKSRDPYFWYSTAIVYSAYHFYDEARDSFYSAKGKFGQCKNFPDLYLRFALFQRKCGKLLDAEPMFKALTTALPRGLTKDDIRLQLAYTCQLIGKAQESSRNREAETHYDALYHANPNVLEVKQQYVWFLSLQTDSRMLFRAREIFSTPEHANDPLLRFAAARIAMKQRDMTDAYQRYRECTPDWTDAPLFWGGLGILYLKNEQIDDAVVAFQRALTLRQDFPEIWLNFGLIYELRNEREQAMKIYQSAMAICTERTGDLRERLQTVGGGRRSVARTLRDVVEMDDSLYFTQPMEIISDRLLETPPDFTLALAFVSNPGMKEAVGELSVPFRSLF